MRSTSDHDTGIAAAVSRVLAAEREAMVNIADCEQQALGQLEAARQQVRASIRETQETIATLHRESAAKTQERIAVIESEIAALGNPQPEASTSLDRLRQTVAAVARDLTIPERERAD